MSIDFGKILKRAWQILWDYKVLWIFGLLLAIFGGAAGGRDVLQYSFNGSDRGFRGVVPNESTNPDVRALNQWFAQHLFPVFTHPLQHLGAWTWIIVGIVLFILLVGLLFALVRYPAETAVIRMVDGYEQDGAKVGFGKGWKLGWNRRAFRIWWIDFLTQTLPALVLVLLLLVMGLGAFYALVSGSRVLGAVSILAAVALGGLLAILIGFGLAFLRLLNRFFWRKVALEDAGTRQAFRQGWDMFKRSWKNALLMWLIMVGFDIGVGIAMAIASLLLIPVYLILLVPALVIAAIPAAIAFGIASLFLAAPWTWIVAALIALPFFFLVLTLPLMFLTGAYIVYTSTVWTLFYRALSAPAAASPVIVPPVPSAPEADATVVPAP